MRKAALSDCLTYLAVLDIFQLRVGISPDPSQLSEASMNTILSNAKYRSGELSDVVQQNEEAEKESAKGEVGLEEAIHELEELEHKHPKPVVIRVNNKPVEMPDKRATGLEIKEVAIQAGVNIKADFVLFAVLANGKQEVVKDDQVIKLHRDQYFEAIDNDDHS
jgi:hypothetical protein